MASYTTLRNGSRGSDVKKLQQSLVDAGYDVGSSGVDGIYGSATEAAVRKYQQDNGLVVDGVAGNDTLGKLYTPAASPSTNTGNSQNAQNNSQPTQQTPTDYSQYQYDASADQAYQDALAALQQAQSQMPTYQATYDQQLQDLYNQIVNRDKFSYDLNADALYQQYKDQYTMQGKLAMMDTMGQAAAMTGGYGNSYSQSVGQQAYQGYLQQLNDVIPELYGMALDQYNQEGQNLLNQYAMLGDMADDEYARYQDALNQYWQNVSYNKQLADDAYNRGYGASRDQIADQQWKDSFLYQQQQDAQAQENWQKEYDFAVQQYTDSQNKSSSSGSSGRTSSGRTSSGGTTNYDNKGYSSSDIKKLQNYLGVTADGKFGPETMKAMRAAGWTTLDDAMSDLNGGKQPVVETNPYEGWDAGDWEGYFANIRQNEGSEAAQKELNYLNSKGLIPKNMVTAAASGARGGKMGH